MIRKVAAGQEVLRAAGTVTKALARWLHQQGWIDDEALAIAVDRGGDAARDLPKADKLASLLYELTQRSPRVDAPNFRGRRRLGGGPAPDRAGGARRPVVRRRGGSAQGAETGH